MRITGSFNVEAPREAFWDALQDPAVLARTLPGCESLQALGDDAYAATLTAGVASIKGTYAGTVQLRDKQPHDSYRLSAEGSGAPGTIRADATLRLEDAGAGTLVTYDADAVVGGMIGGVGQRMIAGAARKTAGEFFTAVANEVLHGPATAPAGVVPGAPGAPGAGAVGAGAPGADAGAGAAGAGAAGADPAGGGGVVPGGAPAIRQVFPGAAATPAAGGGGRAAELFGAFALGAAVALVGVFVGRRTARAEGRRRT